MATPSRMSFRAKGTGREKRIAKCPLSSIKAIAKQSRGSFDYRFDLSNDVFLVRWHDNSVVTMATNYDTINPMASCRRWSKHTKDQANVTQPLNEMIIRYYGHHGLKQFIRGKPIRFGYKYWVICSHNSYYFQFQLYCGKEVLNEQKLPLGSRVVLS